MNEGPDGQTSYIDFYDAFEIYMGYINENAAYDKEYWRKDFQDSVLHPEYGLCVNILCLDNGQKYIVLKCDSVDLTKFYDKLFSDDSKSEAILNKEIVTQVLDNLSSDWDRRCLKYVLSLERNVEEMNILGIKRESASCVKKQVPEVLKAINQSQFAAEDLVNLRNRRRCETIENRLSNKSELLQKKKDIWPEYRLLDIQCEIELDTERLAEIKKLLDPVDSCDKQKLNQMLKRQHHHLIEANRLNKNVLSSQGRPLAINHEVEEVIAKAIEDKATYHGRRHGTTMFTNRRVKSRDLMGIANDALEKEGKAPVRSVTTAWNRSAPRRKNSIQARNHVGMGLWCTKKPPKAEENYNECTHHQRAHVSNVRKFLFSAKSAGCSKYTFMRSIDDKAYLRPGTGEAMDKSRNTRILIPAAKEKAKKLPIHDWPEKKVCITPSAHRIFAKTPSMLDGKERLLTTDDNHIVFLRPKYYVGSSGT